MIEDFLALTLVYADAMKVYRCLNTAPSTAVETAFIAKAVFEWLEWLDDVLLAGDSDVDSLLVGLAKN